MDLDSVLLPPFSESALQSLSLYIFPLVPRILTGGKETRCSCTTVCEAVGSLIGQKAGILIAVILKILGLWHYGMSHCFLAWRKIEPPPFTQ